VSDIDVAIDTGAGEARATTWAARPGRESYRDLVLSKPAVRAAQCAGRFDLRLTVRTADARGRRVTLRRRVRMAITRHPEEKC
jgi:hypothetical protein